MLTGWLGRRRGPRLSGTLHIRDAGGRELAMPLRGRATVLTGEGNGLTGYGEVWAVQVAAGAESTSLMISYGRDGSAEARQSGLCAPGATIQLSGVSFTWRQQTAEIQAPMVPAPMVPAPRTRAGSPEPSKVPSAQIPTAAPAPNMPRPMPTPAKANAHPEQAVVPGRPANAPRPRQGRNAPRPTPSDSPNPTT
jgi:hypothetical protein